MIRVVGHKGRYSRNTLMHWSKKDLVNYIEIVEHNEQTMAYTLEQQAKNFEEMLKNIITDMPICIINTISITL